MGMYTSSNTIKGKGVYIFNGGFGQNVGSKFPIRVGEKSYLVCLLL